MRVRKIVNLTMYCVCGVQCRTSQPGANLRATSTHHTTTPAVFMSVGPLYLQFVAITTGTLFTTCDTIFKYNTSYISWIQMTERPATNTRNRHMHEINVTSTRWFVFQLAMMLSMPGVPRPRPRPVSSSSGQGRSFQGQGLHTKAKPTD